MCIKGIEMATPSVVDFLNRSVVDSALHVQVEQAFTLGLDAVVKLGAQQGYTFTADELQQTVSEAFALQTSPDTLSEVDLDGVVGGAGTPGTTPITPAASRHGYISWGLDPNAVQHQ
jgi:predicted ribosomally synthesized peptide with nif11-like leader